MCYTICYVIMITLQQATHKGGSWHSFSTLRQDCCISCGMNESVELSSIYHTTVPVSLTVGAHMGASNKCWTWKGQFHSILVWRLRNSTGRVGSKRGDGGKNYNFELKPLFVSRRKSNMLVFSDPSSVHTFVTIMKSQDICSCLEVSFFFSETEVRTLPSLIAHVHAVRKPHIGMHDIFLRVIKMKKRGSWPIALRIKFCLFLKVSHVVMLVLNFSCSWGWLSAVIPDLCNSGSQVYTTISSFMQCWN